MLRYTPLLPGKLELPTFTTAVAKPWNKRVKHVKMDTISKLGMRDQIFLKVAQNI